MSDAAKARHAKKTPEQRSAYAKMMVGKREEKRAYLLATQNVPIEKLQAAELSDIKDT